MPSSLASSTSPSPIQPLSAFAKWAMAAAAALVLAPSALVGYSDWSERQVQRMDHWQSEGIAAGLFVGVAENQTALADPRGTHAKINAQNHAAPSVVRELAFSMAGDLFGPSRGEMHSKMTYLHERAHVEYQTAMSSRFDAPGISPGDREAVARGLELNDHGARAALRSRLHGAMHERFAEAYGALALIHEAEGADVGRARIFMSERAAERSSSLEQKLNGEFAHDLGRTMGAVAAMDPGQVRAMAPNQLKAAALRIASLAYLADAKGDKELSALLAPALSRPASQALWARAGTMSGAEIAGRSVSDLPAPEAGGINVAPIKSLVFGFNAPKPGSDTRAARAPGR